MGSDMPNIGYVDLSHTIKHGTITVPNDPPVSFTTVLDRETLLKMAGGRPNSSCEINEIKMVSTSGTYIDAPYHVFEDGKKISDYSINKLVNLPAIVIKKSKEKHYFDVKDIEGVDVKGKAVLFYSGHDEFFMTPKYGENTPYLTIELANSLVKEGAIFVGIDSPLVDDISRVSELGIPVHYKLLEAEIPICEDMTNLGALPSDGFTITALPPKVALESFPARVFATVTS